VTAPGRRRDPQPVAQSWEVAALVAGTVVVGLAVAAVTGLAMASALFGHGWVWPTGTDGMTRVVGGLLTGVPGRGLAGEQAARVPTAVPVYGCVAGCELLVAALITGVAVAAARYRRPGDARRGMATRREAERVLGVSQLRAAREVIRPDRSRRRPHRRRDPVSRPQQESPPGRHQTDGHNGNDGDNYAGLVVTGGAAVSFTPTEVGWRLGRSVSPRGVELYVRYDRTTGVYGAQGSGKTLDILAPALLAHDGAAVATLTKVEDLLLTAGRRAAGGRPIAVLDPFGAAPGLSEFVWDPIAGCVDPRVAEKRAKAFAAGTVTGAVSGGRRDGAARFYAAETAKVLQGFLHAAALTGRTLEHVLEWVANPVAAEQPAEILRQHPHAARWWDGLLAGALHGSTDTVGNTVTTVQQAMGLFFQPEIRARCVPAPGRPATDIADLITARGTIYLLGREDPYASAAPLMTAVAEHVLDTALGAATTSPHGRLTPCFLACLDELPSTTPLPTLRVRMANERALGLSFLYAAQTWKQMVVCYGEDEARSLFGLTNNLVIFGGGKDIHFYKELSDLLDDVRISRQTVTEGPGGTGTSRSGEDVKVLRPGDIRRIPDRHALVVAENAPPIMARLRRCFDGRDGRALKAQLERARAEVNTARADTTDVATRTRRAVAYARGHALTPVDHEPRTQPEDQPDPDVEPTVSGPPPGRTAGAHPTLGDRGGTGRWSW